jgi:hypothetical protein
MMIRILVVRRAPVERGQTRSLTDGHGTAFRVASFANRSLGQALAAFRAYVKKEKSRCLRVRPQVSVSVRVLM